MNRTTIHVTFFDDAKSIYSLPNLDQARDEAIKLKKANPKLIKGVQLFNYKGRELTLYPEYDTNGYKIDPPTI